MNNTIRVIKIANAYNPNFTGGSYAGNIYDVNGASPALNTMEGGGRQPMIFTTENRPKKIKKTNNHMEKEKKKFSLPEELKGRKFRIRKLTCRECYRLMDVDDKTIDKLLAVDETGKQIISNSQNYKLAGNSIVVSCLYYIYEQLMYPNNNTQASPKAPVQLTLF